jgi:hypothetical protein
VKNTIDFEGYEIEFDFFYDELQECLILESWSCLENMEPDMQKKVRVKIIDYLINALDDFYPD